MRHSHHHAPNASGLTRRSVGLTDAHIALIKLLAEAAIEQYLAESESAGETVVTRQDKAAR